MFAMATRKARFMCGEVKTRFSRSWGWSLSSLIATIASAGELRYKRGLTVVDFHGVVSAAAARGISPAFELTGEPDTITDRAAKAMGRRTALN